MKHSILFVIFIIVLNIKLSAQDKVESAPVYGYETRSTEYNIEPADFIVQYKRTQAVVNSQTKEREYLTDTLSLVVGRKWSVFYNTTVNKTGLTNPGTSIFRY